jgi:predicted nicotinamide N-methyase
MGREFVQTDEPRRMERISVLELGCGTGLVGLFLAAIVPHCAVTLTDLPSASELVKRNIDELSRPATGSSAKFLPLEWGQPLPEEIEPEQFDIVILSDCTYNPDNAKALVKTVQQIQERSPDTLVIFASKKRHDTEDLFSDLMAQDGYKSHNRFAIALPTDSNVSASMWAESNVSIGPDIPDDVDLVKFTLYTKGQDEGNDTSMRRPIWADEHHMLADLWIRNKQWSSGSVKRRKSGRAKAIAKAKRKKQGVPYEYGTS